MTRLIGVEFRRLFARRLTLIGTAAAVLITGLLLFAVWRDTAPLSELEQRQAQQAYDDARAEWQLTGEQQIKDCRQEQTQTLPDGTSVCDHLEPQPDQFGKPRAVFAQTAPDYLLGVSFLLAFAGFVIGAGFIGAEFSTGSIGNWLTFEPRRLRVYASKLIAAGGGQIPMAAALVVAMLVGSWLIVRHHDGTTAGTSWGDLAGTGARGVGLTVVAAVAGVGLGGLLRHTAAALGIAMGYLVIVEGVFGGFAEKFQPWLLNVNFQSWVKHGTTYYANQCETLSDSSYSCNGIEKELSFAHSATYLGILVVALLVVGALVFRRRDVT